MVELMVSDEARIAEANAREAKFRVELAKVELQTARVKARAANAELRWRIILIMTFLVLLFDTIVVVEMIDAGVFN